MRYSEVYQLVDRVTNEAAKAIERTSSMCQLLNAALKVIVRNDLSAQLIDEFSKKDSAQQKEAKG